MGPLVIVLMDPAADGITGLIERLIFVEPDLLFLQRAVETLDASIAFGVVVGSAAMSDAELPQGGDETGAGELSAVVGGQPFPLGSQGKTSRTARSSAASASWVRQRKLKSQPTISRVQQSSAETR